MGNSLTKGNRIISILNDPFHVNCDFDSYYSSQFNWIVKHYLLLMSFPTTDFFPLFLPLITTSKNVDADKRVCLVNVLFLGTGFSLRTPMNAYFGHSLLYDHRVYTWVKAKCSASKITIVWTPLSFQHLELHSRIPICIKLASVCTVAIHWIRRVY